MRDLSSPSPAGTPTRDGLNPPPEATRGPPITSCSRLQPLGAGGRIADDPDATEWWAVASPDNHGVDIAAWPDFEDYPE